MDYLMILIQQFKYPKPKIPTTFSQGCILSHRFWKPSQGRFEMLPKIVTSKSSVFLPIMPLFFKFFSSLFPFYPSFSLFFFPSFLLFWKASQFVLKSSPAPLYFIQPCIFYILYTKGYLKWLVGVTQVVVTQVVVTQVVVTPLSTPLLPV